MALNEIDRGLLNLLKAETKAVGPIDFQEIYNKPGGANSAIDWLSNWYMNQYKADTQTKKFSYVPNSAEVRSRASNMLRDLATQQQEAEVYKIIKPKNYKDPVEMAEFINKVTGKDVNRILQTYLKELQRVKF